MTTRVLRGNIAHVVDNPLLNPQSLEVVENGALVLNKAGKVLAMGPWAEVTKTFPDATVSHYGDAWILPGFIDGHIHFPQLYATASSGKQLLDWLEHSIFPSEIRFRDQEFAKQAARQLVGRLLGAGTTTALVFGSQFHHATQALFHEARDQGLRIITGLTLMDRFGPQELFTPAQQSYDAAVSLINEIAEQPLLHYAITPRFAISCSDPLLEVCSQLAREFPQSYIQTHINENPDEIETVRELFPHSKHYADVYDKAGLLKPGTVLAHNVHPQNAELALIRERDCVVCHCPASNSFLGSGLFPMKKHLDLGIRVMMGTDIGAGTNFSILRELGDAYKCQQLQRFRLSAAMLLYLGTHAGAQALDLADRVGNFQVGKDGDLVVLDPAREPYLRERLNHAEKPEDKLFALLNLAGPQHLTCTMVAGRTVYTQ